MSRARFIGFFIIGGLVVIVVVSALRNTLAGNSIGGLRSLENSKAMYDQSMDSMAMTGSSYAVAERALVGNIVPPMSPSYGGGATEIAVKDRLVVRTGYLSLVVKDVAWAIEQITGYIVGQGGFIANSTLEKTGVAPYGSLTVRVATKDYQATLQEMKKYGEVVNQTTNGQDVTEEYIDLDSRLKNLQAAEAQLLEIMKRAGKISEVLEVQNQLTQTRSEIEVLTGRMKYLKQSSEFSTITINIATDSSALPILENERETWKPLAIIKDAARELVGLGQSIVGALIWVAVFIPVWGGIGLIAWFIYRKISRSRVSN